MRQTEPPRSPDLPSLDRRSLFKGGLAGMGLVGIGTAARAQSTGFTHGVASGEPGPEQVLLWGRYTGAADTPLTWEIAETAEFTRPVSQGSVTASPDSDWCVKAVATGLQPGLWYYYRFVAPDGSMSEIGRTRTLPVGTVDKFRMAVFSCSNLGFGYFNAYAHAAEANDFDLVVHTGDYFYEYGRGTYPSPEQSVPGRTIFPADEIVALADYRLRHATYRSDPDLRRLTQSYPIVMGWDDHESANDSYAAGAQNHQADTEGEWDVRKAAAARAYREWVPVSDEPYAHYEIGDLATIFRLETRLGHRSEPPDLGAVLRGAASPQEAFAALTAFRDGEWRDPAREMLGAVQQQWLADGMKTSRRDGKVWQVLAQQVIMGKLSASATLTEGMTDAVPDYVRQRLIAAAAAAQAGLPLNMDAWDGYPAARERVLKAALEADANLLVLAGDSHNAWTFNLDHDGTPVGVEFAGHSVSSPGAEANLPWITPADLAAGSVATNDQLVWADTAMRGYMAVELTPAYAASEYRFVNQVRSRDAGVAGAHRLVTQAGNNTLDG